MTQKRKVKQMETRQVATNFATRDEEGVKRISGYFAVFDDTYDMGQGYSESIARGAFSKTLDNDIRALINHDTSLVLGRNKANTLYLREDEKGLYGEVIVNENDQDAMNLYARVQRGDVDQCSIGFNIREESTEETSDGKIHWTLNDIDLHEVSVCTFPAYKATSVSARSEEINELEERKRQAEHKKWRDNLINKLKGD